MASRSPIAGRVFLRCTNGGEDGYARTEPGYGYGCGYIDVTLRSPMSAFGTKRTCQLIHRMSAIGGKADVTRTLDNVR